jgi:cbb3-type cytochrome oxidase maturation protein
MIVIFLLIPLSIITAAIFLLGFIWAVRSGQYEDTCTPSLRPLMDDHPPLHEPQRGKHTMNNEKVNEQ